MISSVPPHLVSPARAPTMTENLGFEAAGKRIDEIAEVTQLILSPLGSDHASVLGAREESNLEGKTYNRTSEVVWSPSYGSEIIQT